MRTDPHGASMFGPLAIDLSLGMMGCGGHERSVGSTGMGTPSIATVSKIVDAVPFNTHDVVTDWRKANGTVDESKRMCTEAQSTAQTLATQRSLVDIAMVLTSKLLYDVCLPVIFYPGGYESCLTVCIIIFKQ